ncbi:hypothetical protein [Flectobacillus rivi]|uniref:Outer membrane protein beta-barrel domain-containing protein n=1 Tax=Flectobacillus rivi TaxID=2984209 RepID=A0ABT6YVL6_9BACT|nr:hypothetical protein [Flectobacillus rivi]MDI9872922.1 hypothetical protein [Flectobacillus rivi]
MQNPEEDKLKRLLQDTFSDYEPEPSEQTWEYIDASIHPHQPFAAKFAKRLAVAAIALLLLISAGVIFMLKQNSQKSDFQVSLLEKNKDYTQHKKSRLTITKEASLLKKESQNSHSIPSKNNPVPESSFYLHHQKTFSSKQLTQAQPSRTEGDNNTDSGLLSSPSSSTEALNNLTNHFSASIETPKLGIKIDKIESLKSKNILVNQPRIELPIFANIILNKPQKPVLKSAYLSVSITPLQTYRILKIDNPEIVSLQRNKLLDHERNGFEATIGITQSISNSWNFRGSISFLKMRQWAEYKINTDKYLVKNTNQGTIEQITQNKVESENLEMFGLHADIQRLLHIAGRNRYFLSTGTDVMYQLTNGQLNTFLQVSGGVQHTINAHCFLTIEPTASYMLNNINHSSNLIQTSAYNLGLKIGLSYKIQ